MTIAFDDSSDNYLLFYKYKGSIGMQLILYVIETILSYDHTCIWDDVDDIDGTEAVWPFCTVLFIWCLRLLLVSTSQYSSFLVLFDLLLHSWIRRFKYVLIWHFNWDYISYIVHTHTHIHTYIYTCIMVLLRIIEMKWKSFVFMIKTSYPAWSQLSY